MKLKTQIVPMEESRFLFHLESKFASTLALSKFMNLLCAETLSFLSVFSSDPLFSCIVTFCALIFLYLPHLFWKIVFSPVLILTGILLLTILRLGAIQKSEEDEQKENPGKSERSVKEENRASKEDQKEESQNPTEPDQTNSLEQVHQWITNHSKIEFNSQIGFDSNSCFVEWNVKAPLGVIYEEYEGEEAEKDPKEKEENQHMGIARYPSLSRYYPESESESDSDSSLEGGFPATGNWDSPENICFRWDEEDREGLIEIALDGCKKRALEFHFEEENLIEIDISPTRFKELSGEEERFPGEISCN